MAFRSPQVPSRPLRLPLDKVTQGHAATESERGHGRAATGRRPSVKAAFGEPRSPSWCLPVMSGPNLRVPRNRLGSGLGRLPADDVALDWQLHENLKSIADRPCMAMSHDAKL